MSQTRPAKSNYSESEAADEVGLSVEQLRFLIRKHVMDRNTAAALTTGIAFQRTDLLLLKFLAGRPAIRD
jgi:hypothetical protein